MKKSRFTDSQTMSVLKQLEAGVSVAELSGEHNVSTATLYQWRAKYGGMDTSMIKRLKELEARYAGFIWFVCFFYYFLNYVFIIKKS